MRKSRENKKTTAILREKVKKLKKDLDLVKTKAKNLKMKLNFNLKKLKSVQYNNSEVVSRRRKISATPTAKQMLIRRFYQRWDVSTISPNKNSVVKRFGQVKRKRFLQKTHREVFKIFNRENPNVPIGFTTFYKNCPFWIKQMKMSDRNSCACIKHVNFGLIFGKARIIKLVQSAFLSEFIEKIVCVTNSKACAFRECEKCKLITSREVKTIEGTDELVTYFQWATVKDADGKSKCIKQKISITLEEFRSVFLSAVDQFLAHQYRAHHQGSTIFKMKQNLEKN